MNSGLPSRFVGKCSLLPVLFLLALMVAAPAHADRLELAGQLDGWECFRPTYLASSEDGADVYVGGSGENSYDTCLGFAWFRRDAFSGRLKLMKVWGQRELGRGAVGGVALSHDGRNLYVGAGSDLITYARGIDGNLQEIDRLQSSSLDGLSVNPDDGEVWAMGFGVEVYDRAASGLLTYKERLQTNYDSAKPAHAFIHADYAFAGNDFFRRSGGSWRDAGFAWQDYPTSAVMDGSGNYLYMTGEVSGRAHLTVYDVREEFAQPLYHLRISDQGREAAGSLERDPRTGDVYLVSMVGNLENLRTQIRRFTVSNGGRTLTPAGSWAENRGWSQSQLLAFAPDGRHFYTSFENETLALFRVPASGAVYVPGGADPASRFQRPTRTVPASSGDVYLSVSGAIQRARRVAGGLEIVETYDFANWGVDLGSEPAFSVALTPDGSLAVVISISSTDSRVRLALAVRDAAGALALRPETSQELGSIFCLPSLAIGPDSRFLYLTRENRVDIYRIERNPLRLVPVETPGLRGRIEIAPSGRDALVGSDYYLRDPATGLLTPAAEPVPGWNGVERAVYSRGGNLLIGLAERDFAPRLMVIERSGAGWRLLGEQALPDTRSYYDLFAEPHGRRLFLAGNRQVEPYTRGLQLWEWDSGAFPYRFAHEIEAPLLSDNPSSGPFFSVSHDGNDVYATTFDRNLLRIFRAKCEPGSAYSACLGNSRYRVEIDWRDAAGVSHPALPTRIGSDDSRLFTFFDADNWEVLTKVLDGCGINQRVWVYSAATTDVGNALRVTDTWSGRTAAYDNPAGTPAAAITDGDALDVCAVPSPGWIPVPDTLPPVTPAGALLEVQNGRFEVGATWVTAGGQRGNATSLSAQTAAAGLFYFFSPENWEIQAKVLDGCAINDRFWFFAAATTDVGYTLTVRDRQSGRVETYQNPVGRAAPAITDIDAFACP